ncbi:MAG: hypothetical protein ABIH23_32800 [bacterium]
MRDLNVPLRGINVLGIAIVVAANFCVSAMSADVEICVQVDRGEDIGQNFGSLFEARTKDGAFVIGAGFLGVYNTYYRSDRHTVHFFIRPTSGAREHTLKRLPRPSDLAGTYLFSQEGKLYAADPEVRVWNETEQRWDMDTLKQRGRMRIGNDLLLFDGSQVEFNGQLILTEPEEGKYSRFYYARGHLFFYHTFWAGQDGYRPHLADIEGYTKLYACPWRPEHGNAVDLTKAVVMTLPFVGENPFAYGQLNDDVLTCSNIGGIYVFNGEQWRTVVNGELKTSYQVYSMLNYYDRLIMGQYPTGEIFEFDGETVKHLEGWPPRMEGVSGSAREAQTTAIYGGELFVGVWPWGELWNYHPEMKRWTFIERMFTHPPTTDKTTHPYENECAALGGVINQWGQRVTSLVPLGPSLMISTSAKWPCEWEPKFDFIASDKWKEYGAVIQLDIPGHLSAPLAWTEGLTELRFIVSDSDMRIEQDGHVIARTELGNSLSKVSASAAEFGDVVWGHGIYGAFSGSALHGEISVAK